MSYENSKEFGMLRGGFHSLATDLAAAREEVAVWKGLCIGLLATLAGVVVVAGVAFFII